MKNGTRDDYDAVDALAAVLRERPLTAVAIMRLFNCSKVTAYDRLRTLADRGAPLMQMKVREGQSGPESTAHADAFVEYARLLRQAWQNPSYQPWQQAVRDFEEEHETLFNAFWTRWQRTEDYRLVTPDRKRAR